METLDAFGTADFEPQLETPFGSFDNEQESESSAIGLAANMAPWHDEQASLSDDTLIQSESEADVQELFEVLRDQAFDEAVLNLAQETEILVVGQITNEAASNFAERERLAERHLDSVRYESEVYLDGLREGVSGADIASYSDEQLTQFLDSFDHQPSDLSPASEDFFRKLVKKAKKAVKWVAKKAKKVASSAVLGPILNRLKKLVKPLLKRVLSFAIGRLPSSLRPLARKLAARFKLEAESAGIEQRFAWAHQGPSVLMLAQEFDAAIADGIVEGTEPEEMGEAWQDHEAAFDSAEARALETLEAAREQLLNDIRGAEHEQDLAVQIEQFVPAILAAMRIGIRLIGRPKVVKFLAKFLAKLISRWVGPQMAKPLSNAIVDAGLKMVSLEAEAKAANTETDISAQALAGVIEDTVRRFAAEEDYVLDDSDLAEIAAHEAFSASAATYFPASLLKPRLRKAPKLGGTFVRRKVKSLRPYAKYSRATDVNLTEQMADDLPAFGEASLGSVLRNAGARFPAAARVHIYQALAGSSPAQILYDGRDHSGMLGSASLQPLNETAAALLLGEADLGTSYTHAQLRHPRAAEAGQRMYMLEILDQGGNLRANFLLESESQGVRRGSRFSQRIDRSRRAVVLSWYISERKAQEIAALLRRGSGSVVVLRTMMNMMRSARMQGESGYGSEMQEAPFDGLESEAFSLGDLGGVFKGLKAQLAKQVRRWTAPFISRWLKKNIPVVLRAVDHPDHGITIQVILTGVPGLSYILDPSSAIMRIGRTKHPFAGKPEFKVRVLPGRGQ